MAKGPSRPGIIKELREPITAFSEFSRDPKALREILDRWEKAGHTIAILENGNYEVTLAEKARIKLSVMAGVSTTATVLMSLGELGANGLVPLASEAVTDPLFAFLAFLMTRWFERICAESDIPYNPSTRMETAAFVAGNLALPGTAVPFGLFQGKIANGGKLIIVPDVIPEPSGVIEVSKG